MPVLIIGTFDENGRPDAMNAAWGGIHDTNEIAVCIAPEHKTAENLRRHRAFTVAFGDAAHLAACDYVGLVSGNTTPDKVQKAGFHAESSAFVHAPVFQELPVCLECELLSFDEKTGCTVGKIVNVSAGENALDENGKIDPEKFSPLVFDPVHHVYRRIGAVAGNAFQAGRSIE